jgi:hypothetical protein
MKKIIKFVSNRLWLTQESSSKPLPSGKVIPEWYRSADRYATMPNGEPWIGPDGGKVVTWKSCPALYDIMTTGYVYRTPCDIEFYINEIGDISAKVLDQQYADFLHVRAPMPQFISPMGYHESHFAWWSDWAVELPDGYSALYSQPFNRFDLPFITTSGIIDNDKVSLPGTMPFFVVKGWTGVLPAGTPYAQIVPFKREDWKSENILENPNILAKKNMDNSHKYRKPGGGIYQTSVWTRRKYE